MSEPNVSGLDALSAGVSSSTTGENTSSSRDQEQNETTQPNQVQIPPTHHQIQPVVVLPSPSTTVEKSVNSSSGGNGAVKSNGISRAIVGSRSGGGGSQFLPGLHNATLPSKIAIIVGLCQVGLGGAMVLTGILAIRYQSYLFHYGTGLWAGLLSAISGMLGAMCTKKGVPKPSWLCGGRKWQIHVFLLAILLSLSSVVLLAIFSTSGLLQDAKTVMAVDIESQSGLDEMLENRNTSGIIINTLLLLLSILQVLLCFSSLGIAVRVLFKSKRSLLSSKGSTGSEVAIRGDVGGEYRARKDHLIHWLGNQRPPNVIPLGFGSKKSSSLVSSNVKNTNNRHLVRSNGGGLQVAKYPTLVAIQPVMYPAHPHHHHRMIPAHPGMIIAPQFAFAPQLQVQPVPQMMQQSFCAVHGTTPAPISNAPSVLITSPHKSRQQRGGGGGGGSSTLHSSGTAQDYERRQRRRGGYTNSNQNILQVVPVRSLASNSVKSFETRSRKSSSNKAPSVISVKTESEKNNEVEITEVDVSRTYTGLDRDIAENYICAMGMSSSRKESSVDEDFDLSDRDQV